MATLRSAETSKMFAKRMLAHEDRESQVPADPIIDLISVPLASPSVADRWTKEQRAALMSRVRTTDTGPELSLRRALWSAGVRGWRVNVRTITGRPDLAWRSRRVAVFVDGAFWHGHPDHYWGQSGEFWDRKIGANRARDQQVTAELESEDWIVLRLWDFEVKEDPAACVERVRDVLASRPIKGRT